MKRDESPLFRQFVYSYLIVVVLSLVITLVVYRNGMSDYRRQGRETEMAQFISQVTLLDSRIQELESLTQKLGMDKNVINIMGFTPDFATPDSYRYRELYQSIALYPLTNEFIEDFFIYFNNSQTLISSDSIALKMSIFYNGFLQYEEMDYKTWTETLNSRIYNRDYFPSQTVKRGGTEYSYVTYLQSIPLGRTTNKRAVVFALVRDESIYEYFKSLPYLQNNSRIQVSHNGRELISWQSTDFAESNTGHMESFYTSPYTGWEFHIAYPANFIDSKIGKFRNIFLFAEGIMLIIGVFLALYSSYRNSRPYYNLYNEVEELKSNHRQSLKEALLEGRFPNEKALENQMAWCGFSFEGQAYQIGILSVFLYLQEDDTQMSLIHLNQLIEEITQIDRKNILLHHRAGMNHLVILVRDPEENRGFWKKLESLINEKVYKKNPAYEWELHLIKGQSFGHLIETSLYYEELQHILEYIPHDTLGLINHRDDFISSGHTCYYPLNQEQRLLLLVKDGNYEQIQSVLNHIFDNNPGAQLSPDDLEELEREMIGTLYRLIRQEENGTEKGILEMGLFYLKQNKDYTHFQKQICRIYREICQAKSVRRKEESSRLTEKAQNLLTDNYAEPALCLTYAADRLGVTGKYLSREFKSVTGENFSLYLEKIRMEKAKGLLSDMDIKVVDIPSRVGYSNNNTFYKAFKRYFGVNPSAFR